MITCCMTSHNPKTEWLEKAIGSTVSFEQLIVHKNTEFLIPTTMRYATTTIERPKSISQTSGINLAISKAQTEWVSILSDDDWYHSDTCLALIPELALVKKDIIYAPYFVFDEPTQKLGIHIPPSKFNIQQLLNCNFIGYSSFFRKQVWQDLGGFKEGTVNDHDFWIRAFQAGFQFGFFPAPLHYFRIRPDSLHMRMMREGLYKK